MNSTTLLQVAVASPYPINSTGLLLKMRGWNGIADIRDFKSYAELTETLLKTHYQWLLLEDAFCGFSLIKTIHKLQALFPSLQITVLTECTHHAYAKRILSTGINGMIHKTTDGSEILAARDAVMESKKYTCPVINVALSIKKLHLLTVKEIEVLVLKVRCIKTEDICVELKITKSTLETHCRNINYKIGSDFTAWFQYAINNNLVTVFDFYRGGDDNARL